MGRIRTLASGLSVAVLSAGVTSCAFMPDPTFAALNDALTVRLVDATRTPGATSIDFHFELINHGRTMAEACVGPPLTVAYDHSSIDAISGSLDRPGCAHEFHIPPGRKMLWDELLDLPDLPQSRIAVEANVQIIDPERCSSWGCASFDLTSNQIEIPST